MSFSVELEQQRQAAAARFKAATTDRKQVKAQLAHEDAFAVESAERVATRRAMIPINDSFGLERIIGPNNLMAINYLALGLQAAKSVCRIHIRDTSGRPAGFGSGFMVSPTLLLTNHHVLEAREYALRSLAEFDFETDINFLPKPTHYFRLAPERFFYNDKTLDFALVAVHPQSLGGVPLTQYGFLPLMPQSGKVLKGEAVSIIQHPDGGDKHIALRSNHILDLLDGFIHYETDTLPGSSGSPVFNDQWQVAALHHAGVPRVNAQGKILNKSGRIWQPEQGDDAIDWIGNEGVRISAIFDYLHARQGWQAHEVTLLKQLDSTLGGGAQDFVVGGGAIDGEITEDEAPGVQEQPPVLTLGEFLALVDDPATTEATLAPYMRLDRARSDAFDPAFRLNSDLVVDPSGLESDRVLGWANDWARSQRQRRYRAKVNANPAVTRIVAEGDSWFQYPFVLHDVIDHVMDQAEYAVFCLGAAGDLLRDMVSTAEYVDAIEREQPTFFLMSGGGNDLVGGNGLAAMLQPFAVGLQPHEYLNQRFDAFTQQIQADYQRLFSALRDRFPHLKIICHGYDYPRPRNERWLGQPMRQRGIEDPTLQQQILVVIMDRMNTIIEATAGNFTNVRYLNLRNLVTTNEWFDELHPNNLGFRKVSALFLDALRTM